MPNVEVRDAKGDVLKTYEMIVENYAGIVTDDFIFDMAKQNAIEDELVAPEDADTLRFRKVDRFGEPLD